MAQEFPKIERGCNIEVPHCRNGRPGYRWVQGWVVRYSKDRVSLPMRLNEARDYLREVLKGTA